MHGDKRNAHRRQRGDYASAAADFDIVKHTKADNRFRQSMASGDDADNICIMRLLFLGERGGFARRAMFIQPFMGNEGLFPARHGFSQIQRGIGVGVRIGAHARMIHEMGHETHESHFAVLRCAAQEDYTELYEVFPR